MGLRERKLPVGIQSFDQIINENFLLIETPSMKAYWEGKKKLFKGLRGKSI